MLWLLRHNRLPTYQSLASKGLLANPNCPICGQYEESAVHASINTDCTWAKDIWKHLVQPAAQTSFLEKSITDWIDWNLTKDVLRYEWDIKWSLIFTETVFVLWQERNKVVHEEGNQSPLVTLEQIRRRGEEAVRAFVNDPDRNVESTRIQWVKPEAGVIKLNVDGAVRNNGNENEGPASIGGVFRDHSGQWLLGFAEMIARDTPLGVSRYTPRLRVGYQILVRFRGYISRVIARKR